MNCADKVAIVTGAAGAGMGRSIALTLAREGAKVVVNYRTSRENAENIVGYIRGCEGEAISVQADICVPEDCARLVKVAQEQFGQVDICVVGPGGGWHPEPVDQLAPADGLENLTQEVSPILNMMPLVLPGMYARGWGRLIAIAQHPTLLPPAYAYNLGKAARAQALLLTREQAWAHHVTVNVIAPGPVASIPSLEAAIEHCEHGAAWRERQGISPQDIAEGVAFLCSEAGRFLTGAVVPYLFD